MCKLKLVTLSSKEVNFRDDVYVKNYENHLGQKNSSLTEGRWK